MLRTISLAPNRSCGEFAPPAQKLGPHVAALGMRFYTGSMFPARYRNQIFIAEHGSWNRSAPIGYRITLVELKENRPSSYQTFAEGWLQRGKAWGRPSTCWSCPMARYSFPMITAEKFTESPTENNRR